MIITSTGLSLDPHQLSILAFWESTAARFHTDSIPALHRIGKGEEKTGLVGSIGAKIWEKVSFFPVSGFPCLLHACFLARFVRPFFLQACVWKRMLRDSFASSALREMWVAFPISQLSYTGWLILKFILTLWNFIDFLSFQSHWHCNADGLALPGARIPEYKHISRGFMFSSLRTRNASNHFIFILFF